jgi:Zn-dependent protease
MFDINNFLQNIAVSIPGLLLAVTCHEVAHGYVALKFGDPTAKNLDRLTLNPIAHADPIGTVLFPLIGAMFGGVIFGWAKPVPVDTRYFKNVRKGIFWVSFAGPLANFALALISAILLAFTVTQVPNTFELYPLLLKVLQASVLINIIIGLFNLIPFPPLDGSKMAATFMDYNTARRYEELQRYWIVFLLILWMTPIFGMIARPVVNFSNLVVQSFIFLFS